MLLLANDLVVNEDSCNLSCEYCLTGQSNLKEQHSELRIFQPPVRDDCRPGTDLGDRIRTVANEIRTRHDNPVLKLTGGELYLISGMTDLIVELSADYETVIVQTNAVLVKDDDLDALRRPGNVILQISLDSHLFTGNSYRVKTEAIHRRAMGAIERCLDAGLFVEIYAVINDRSVDELVPFAQYLSGFDDLRLFPFPVRGPISEGYQIAEEQIRIVEDFVDRWSQWPSLLPHVSYGERLRRFYRCGQRTFGCHLPSFVVSSFSDGVVTPCPNIWFSDMGNVLSDRDRALDNVGTSPLYQLLLADRPRIDACKGCFTPWDTLSMYADGELPLDALVTDPPYNGPRARSRIDEIVAARQVEAVR